MARLCDSHQPGRATNNPPAHPAGIKVKKVRKVLSSLYSLYSAFGVSYVLNAFIHKERKKILIKTF